MLLRTNQTGKPIRRLINLFLYLFLDTYNSKQTNPHYYHHSLFRLIFLDFFLANPPFLYTHCSCNLT
ncbi:hypothetical protein L6452_42759 [Arctium lappa]|uniref:Uncharacterized protein n=1 Tax=Arctium lappa TaxID=4217 RepID=A0ACB8XJI5_ARCLA|nr:hypothetical protein L6452_42759 [Arctium lappa]